MYLLDTNVISEMRKVADGTADPAVTAWVVSRPIETSFISAMTVMELEIGVLRLSRRNRVQAAALRRWVDERVLPEFATRILAFDSKVALVCASLHVPDKRSDRDAIIAATALANGLTVVTRNVVDFAETGVRIIDPWAST